MKTKIIICMLAMMASYAHAYAGNCDSNKGKTGTVKEIYLGVDDDTAENVTISFLPDGEKSEKEVTLSLKKQVDTDAGRAAYAIVIAAFTGGAKIKIMSCQNDQVYALAIK